MSYPKDLTGMEFNYLEVIGKDEERSKKGRNSYWLCKCECGNITSVMRTNLTKNRVKSCGCKKIELLRRAAIKDLTGQQINEMTVLECLIDEKEKRQTSRHTTYWKVRCSCGNVFVRSSISLKNTVSCGCKKSKGEYKIIQILKENNIKYEYQYWFPDFFFKDSHRHGYFDFALFDLNNNLKCIIEFNGEQHYAPSGVSWNTHERFKEIQKRDNEKKLYCKKNNIPLEEIPYKYLNKLDKIILEICKKYDLIKECARTWYTHN